MACAISNYSMRCCACQSPHDRLLHHQRAVEQSTPKLIDEYHTISSQCLRLSSRQTELASDKHLSDIRALDWTRSIRYCETASTSLSFYLNILEILLRGNFGSGANFKSLI